MSLTAHAAAEGAGEARMSEDECIREGVLPEQDEALSGSAGIAEAPGPSADEGAVDGPGSSIEACDRGIVTGGRFSCHVIRGRRTQARDRGQYVCRCEPEEQKPLIALNVRLI